MADRTANVGIVFNADLTKARKDYEEWMREVESRPVSIRLRAGNGGGRTRTTTFADKGGDPLDREVTASPGVIQQPAHITTVANARSYGSGFANPSGGLGGLAHGPGPYANIPGMATTNTYYGDATRALGAGRYGGRWLPDVTPQAPRTSPGAFAPSIPPGATGAFVEGAPASHPAGAMTRGVSVSGMTPGQASVNAWRSFVASEILNAYTPAAGPSPMRGPVLPGTLMSQNPQGAGLGRRLVSGFLNNASIGSVAQASLGIAFTGVQVAEQYLSDYSRERDLGRFGTVAEMTYDAASGRLPLARGTLPDAQLVTALRDVTPMPWPVEPCKYVQFDPTMEDVELAGLIIPALKSFLVGVHQSFSPTDIARKFVQDWFILHHAYKQELAARLSPIIDNVATEAFPKLFTIHHQGKAAHPIFKVSTQAQKRAKGDRRAFALQLGRMGREFLTKSLFQN